MSNYPTAALRSLTILLLFEAGLGLFVGRLSAQVEPAQAQTVPVPAIPEPTERPGAEGVVDPPPLAQVVARLLDQLEKGNPSERQAAEQELMRLGSVVIPHLPRFTSSIGGEFRNVVDRIRDQLQSKAIGEYSQPSSITLAGRFAADEVLLELMEQSDNDLSVEQIPSTQVEVDFERTPFWEALDEVLDQLKLEIDPSSRDGVLKLIPIQHPVPRASRGGYAGVFRFEPKRIEATRTIPTDHLSHLDIAFELAWEPRLRPVYFHLAMNNAVAECDNGEILRAVSPDATQEYVPTDSHAIEASMMFGLPSRNAKKIARLSGSLVAAIPGATVQLEFDKLDEDQGKEQKVGNLRVTLEETKKIETVREFRLLISLTDAGQTMDSFRGWLMSHEAFVLDANGKRIDHAGWQTYRMSSEAVGLKYYFDLGESLDGYRLIYSAPGAVTEQRVDFLLKDIALP